MSSPANGVAVALLCERRESGAHLRETLTALGATIVYEASASGFDRDALANSQARVVVVNLDGEGDPAIDTAYALLDDARYHVVFNDAEVSRGLSGWDQARWMRHLAAKIFGDVDIDPPRPDGAESVPLPGSPHEKAAPTRVAIEATVPGTRSPVSDPAVFDIEPDQVATASAAFGQPSGLSPVAQIAGDAGSQDRPTPSKPPPPPLAVEDFALDFDVADDTGASGEAIAERAADDLSALDFDFDLEFPDQSTRSAGSGLAPESAADDLPASGFDLDLDLDEVFEMSEASSPSSAASSNWALEDALDDGESPPVPVGEAGRANFGIETMSPAEYLAPVPDADAAEAEAPMTPLSALSLELIPLEEAVAPTAIEALDHENWLDPDNAPKAKVRRVWVLGASIGGPESVREFLGEFPRDYPALFLLAQHMGEEFVDTMTQQLARSTALTVRMPGHGERVGHGEVLVVPNAQRLLVDPNGVVVLERAAGDLAYRPSIDRVLEDVADRFGADAGAIIFSGMSDDAVEGCRRIAEKGGSVYAQDPDTCVVSTMIDGVRDTGVVAFLGSPKELAAKLLAERA